MPRVQGGTTATAAVAAAVTAPRSAPAPPLRSSPRSVPPSVKAAAETASTKKSSTGAPPLLFRKKTLPAVPIFTEDARVMPPPMPPAAHLIGAVVGELTHPAESAAPAPPDEPKRREQPTPLLKDGMLPCHVSELPADPPDEIAAALAASPELEVAASPSAPSWPTTSHHHLSLTVLRAQESVAPYAPRARVQLPLELNDSVTLDVSSALARVPELDEPHHQEHKSLLDPHELAAIKAAMSSPDAALGETSGERRARIELRTSRHPVCDRWETAALASIRVELNHELSLDDREGTLAQLDGDVTAALLQCTIGESDSLQLQHRTVRDPSPAHIEVVEDEEEEEEEAKSQEAEAQLAVEEVTTEEEVLEGDDAASADGELEEQHQQEKCNEQQQAADSADGQFDERQQQHDQLPPSDEEVEAQRQLEQDNSSQPMEIDDRENEVQQDETMASNEPAVEEIQIEMAAPVVVEIASPVIVPALRSPSIRSPAITRSPAISHTLPSQLPSGSESSPRVQPIPFSPRPTQTQIPSPRAAIQPQRTPPQQQPQPQPQPPASPAVVATADSSQPSSPLHKRAKLVEAESSQIAPTPATTAPATASFVPTTFSPVSLSSNVVANAPIFETPDQFLPAHEYAVDVDDECFDMHTTIYTALQGVWPALVAANVITADQQTLAAWAPVRLNRLIYAKRRHVLTLGRAHLPSQLAELRQAQNSWRDLQALYFCVVVSHTLLHCGIHAAWAIVQRFESQAQWMDLMATVEIGSGAVTSRLQQLQPVRTGIHRLHDYMQRGVVWDSPKIQALLTLIRDKRWLRHWQESKRLADEADEAGPTGSSLAARVGAVTVILVQQPHMVKALQLFIEPWVAASIVEGPSDKNRPNAAAEQEPQRFLGMFSSAPVLIGCASYLLPHASFPWSFVGALVHYDTLDPFLLWNDQAQPVAMERFEASAMVRDRITKGEMDSWTLTSKVEESRVLWPPADRLLEEVKPPTGYDFRIVIDQTWVAEHSMEIMCFTEIEVGLVHRSLKPVTMILDNATAVVVLELQELVQAAMINGEDKQQRLDVLIESLRPLALRFHTVHFVLYDPSMALASGSIEAGLYTEFELTLHIILSDDMSAAVGRAHSFHRSRTPLDLLLHVMQLAKQTEKAFKASGADPECPWYDRGWLNVYETLPEHFLALCPGMNFCSAQYVLNRHVMELKDFWQLDPDVAYEALDRGIPKDLLLRTLTNVQYQIRPPLISNSPSPEPEPEPQPEIELQPQEDEMMQPVSEPSTLSALVSPPLSHPPSMAREEFEDQLPHPASIDAMTGHQLQWHAIGTADQAMGLSARRTPTRPREEQLHRKHRLDDPREHQVEQVQDNYPVKAKQISDRVQEKIQMFQALHSSGTSNSGDHSRSSSSASIGSLSRRKSSHTISELRDANRVESAAHVTEGTLTPKKRGTSEVYHSSSATSRHQQLQQDQHDYADEPAVDMSDEEVDVRQRHPRHANEIDDQEEEEEEFDYQKPSSRSYRQAPNFSQPELRGDLNVYRKSGGGGTSRTRSSSQLHHTPSQSSRRSLFDSSEEHRRVMEETRGKKARIGFEKTSPHHPVTYINAHKKVIPDPKQTRINMQSVPLSPHRRVELPPPPPMAASTSSKRTTLPPRPTDQMTPVIPHRVQARQQQVQLPMAPMAMSQSTSREQARASKYRSPPRDRYEEDAEMNLDELPARSQPQTQSHHSHSRVSHYRESSPPRQSQSSYPLVPRPSSQLSSRSLSAFASRSSTAWPPSSVAALSPSSRALVPMSSSRSLISSFERPRRSHHASNTIAVLTKGGQPKQQIEYVAMRR